MRTRLPGVLAVSLTLLPGGASNIQVQHWTYNATLWWGPLFQHHSLHGPWLQSLASESTDLIEGVFTASKVACFTPDVQWCEVDDECKLPVMVSSIRDLLVRFHTEVGTVVKQLAAAVHTEGDHDVYISAAKLQAGVGDLAPVSGCEGLVAALHVPDPEGCAPLVMDSAFCMRGLSTLVREAMAELHAVQIRAIGEVSGVVLDVTIPPHPQAMFDGSRGLERAEILESLLAETVNGRDLTITSHSPLLAAEIGVDDGRTSEALLSHIPDLQLLLIDPFEFASADFFEREPTRSLERAASTSSKLWERIGPFRNRSIIIAQRSLDASAWVAPGILHLVFIDGDHEYGAVRDDLKVWHSKLRSNGVLAGHDYSLFRPGVIRAVHEFAADVGLPVWLGPDHMWWFRF